MLRIAMCDDETEAREALYLLLDQELHEESEQIVYEFSTGTAAANWLQKHPGEIDLLFLDVEMDGMNGMETAKKIRTFDQNLLIVFVTGFADYVFDGYSVGAMDYLMKPVCKEKLQAVLTRVREKLGQEEAEEFIVKNTDGTYRFLKKEIRWFYSDKRKVMLVTDRGEYGFYAKLDEVEKQLKDGGEAGQFVRIHQRYLVNTKWVDQIGSASVQIGGEELPISRAYKEAAVKKLAEAMLGGMR